MTQQLIDSPSTASLPAWIEIRRSALLENLQTIANFQPAGMRILAVIKANAYGHGLKAAAGWLDKRVDYLGVSSLREVLELKEYKIETPVFLLSRLMPHEIETAVKEKAALSVSSIGEAQAISEAAKRDNTTAKIHIKVDTGMGRLGIPLESAFSSIEKISQMPNVDLEGIFTHFPSAESSDGFTERQVRDFGLLLQALETKGISFRYRHGANSAASLRVNSPIFNMIRPGLMLYGMVPDESFRKTIPLSPVLSLKSRIISLKRLMPGQSAGYGRQFVTDKPATIALLPIGYSHGYPWRAAASASALWQGKHIPFAGRISMDYLCLNFGDLHPALGDEVTLIGEENGSRITAEDVAGWAGTIPYEITTGFSLTLPRVYIG